MDEPRRYREFYAPVLDPTTSDSFRVHLTDERVKAGGARLKALGEPEKVELRGTSERGGMEVATVLLTYKTATVRASLYRTPDGKIQQLLYYAE